MASVKKHILKSGEMSYYFRAFDGRDSNGKQIERTMTWKPFPGMTKKQIEKELSRQKILFDERVKKGFVLDGTTKFSEYAEIWLKNNEPPQLAPKTYERYCSLLKTINQGIGHIRLERLQSHHLQAFYKQLTGNSIRQDKGSAIAKDGLQDIIKVHYKTRAAMSKAAELAPMTITTACRGKKISLASAQAIAKALNMELDKLFNMERDGAPLSDKTILHHHRLISSILGQATRDRIVPFNVADRDYIKAPKVERKEARYLDEQQAQRVVELLWGEPIKWRTAILLLLFTGMRRGELMGLEWSDIDFKNKLITICRTSQYVSGLGIIAKETKNKSSERVLKVTDDILGLLREYRSWWLTERLKMGDLWQRNIEIIDVKGNKTLCKNDRIFIKDDSTPMHPDSLTSWTAEFVKRHDLPPFSPHSLRHTNVTLQIAAGVPLRTVSARAGHAQTSTTANIYSHAIQSAEQKAAEAISESLGLKINKAN